MKIIAINAPEPTHLASVIEAMQDLGASTIKAVWMEVWGAWVALEGSHRLAAASALGVTPELEEIDYDETTSLADLGCDDSGDGFTVADICDSAWERSGLTYTF